MFRGDDECSWCGETKCDCAMLDYEEERIMDALHGED